MPLPRILHSKIRSPSGENMLCALQSIRKSEIFGGRVMTLPYSVFGIYSSRPVASSIPSMMFMFWMAAPEAPLPRLSNRAVTMVCFS